MLSVYVYSDGGGAALYVGRFLLLNHGPHNNRKASVHMIAIHKFQLSKILQTPMKNA